MYNKVSTKQRFWQMLLLTNLLIFVGSPAPGRFYGQITEGMFKRLYIRL